MGRITLQQAANWCGGWIDPKYKDVTFLGANNDTRKTMKENICWWFVIVPDVYWFLI